MQTEVNHISRTEFLLKVCWEQKPGGFSRLMEAINSFGFQVENANMTTIDGKAQIILTVETCSTKAGDNKGDSDKQIFLKKFSPNVLDITLVDLPSIIKVPVSDQPSDIEARIRTMIMSYIKVPSCLILAVTPANLDLANSDALQMAGIADPDGVLLLPNAFSSILFTSL
ncbi:hypothetical protein HN51_054853, partial [Arachis hypogaea]